MKNENLLQLILEQSEIGFWDWNYKTNKIKLSTSSKRLLGFAEYELEEEFDINILTDQVFPEDLAHGLETI